MKFITNVYFTDSLYKLEHGNNLGKENVTAASIILVST